MGFVYKTTRATLLKIGQSMQWFLVKFKKDFSSYLHIRRPLPKKAHRGELIIDVEIF